MKSILGIGSGLAATRAREAVRDEAASSKAEMLERLRDLHARSERALTMLRQGSLRKDQRAEVSTLISSLKDQIGAEYRRLWPIRAQGNLRAEESSYYWPAIAEIWEIVGLKALRAHGRPNKSWRKTVEAADERLNHYRQLLERA